MKKLMMAAMIAVEIAAANAVTMTGVSITADEKIYVGTDECVGLDPSRPNERFTVTWQRVVTDDIGGYVWEPIYFPYGSNCSDILGRPYHSGVSVGNPGYSVVNHAKICVIDTNIPCTNYHDHAVQVTSREVIGYLRGNKRYYRDDDGKLQEEELPNWQWSTDDVNWHDVGTEPIEATPYVEPHSENYTCECFYNGYCHNGCYCDCFYCQTWRAANQPKQKKTSKCIFAAIWYWLCGH